MVVYGKILIKDKNGKEKKITNLKDFLMYRGIDIKLINLKNQKEIK